MTIHIDKRNIDEIYDNSYWNAILVRENRITVKLKPFFKMEFLLALIGACFFFVVGILYFTSDQVLALICSIIILVFIAPILYLLLYIPIKTFKELELECRNGIFTINNKKVSDICIFAVCDPDYHEFNKDKGNVGQFGFDSEFTKSGACPLAYAGFQFKTESKLYQMMGVLDLNELQEMKKISDFLLTNNIYFTYQHKKIRPNLICLKSRFKNFENKFELEKIDSFEADVQGIKRYIRKEDKYPSDGILADHNKNQQS
jgi:hypothetical protein